MGTSNERAARAIALADGALGAAGHAVTDDFVRAVWEATAEGHITYEEGVELILTHFFGDER